MIQFPLAYVLSKHTNLGPNGIWCSFPVTNVMVAIIAMCWFARGGWKNTRITEDNRQTVKVTEEALSEEGYRHQG